MQPKTAYRVTVCVTTNNAETAQGEAGFETGLMTYENMTANWITHGFEDDLEACAVFVKDFACKGDIAKARLYASTLGIYEYAIINVHS